MNTIIPGALPPLVARVQETGTPHHRLPGYSDDVSNVLALESRVGSKSESVEETPNPLSEMTCVYFDDFPVQLKMVGRFMEKKGFKKSSVFDTSSNKPSPEEKALIINSDFTITDMNDTNSTDDPSGGLRRIKIALEAGKMVIALSGHAENGKIIDREFSEQYKGQYIFFAKPYGFEDIEKGMQTLIERKLK